MRDQRDEEIQRLLEQQFSMNDLPEAVKALDENKEEPSNEDFLVYQQLFKVLKKESKEGLPFDFSARLRFKLQGRLARKTALKFYLTWAFIFVFGMAGVMAMLVLWDHSYDTGLLAAVWHLKGIFAFSFVCLFLIQYLDHKTLKSG